MEQEKVFLIDCDEVLRQTLSKMIEVYNKHFPDKKKVEDVKSFKTEISFPEIEKITGQTASHWFFQEHGEEMFLDTEPFPHVKEDIETLKKYGKVIILTYQKTYANKRHTLEWLEKVGIEPDGICFMKDKTLVKGDYLIDDNDWNFKGNHAKYGILIDAPYNKDKSVKEVLLSSNCSKIERFENLHEFTMAYDEAEKAIALGRENFPHKKTFKLIQAIPYIDSTVYHNQRVFGYVGASVSVVNWYIDGTTPIAVVQINGGWGSCGVKIEDLKNCIEYEQVRRNC